VLPIYLNAGRFSYIIEYPSGVYWFHKSVIHYRKEPIPIKVIQASEKIDSCEEESDAEFKKE